METEDKFKNCPTHDKSKVLEMMDKLEPKEMVEVVAFIQNKIESYNTNSIDVNSSNRMGIYVLLTDNNVSYTKEFKGLWEYKPSPEQLCLMADKERPVDEWLGMGVFLLDNIGLKMNGYWIEVY